MNVKRLIVVLGLGFMFAHSSLLTTATAFAEKAGGTTMSLVAAWPNRLCAISMALLPARAMTT